MSIVVNSQQFYNCDFKYINQHNEIDQDDVELSQYEKYTSFDKCIFDHCIFKDCSFTNKIIFTNCHFVSSTFTNAKNIYLDSTCTLIYCNTDDSITILSDQYLKLSSSSNAIYSGPGLSFSGKTIKNLGLQFVNNYEQFFLTNLQSHIKPILNADWNVGEYNYYLDGVLILKDPNNVFSNDEGSNILHNNIPTVPGLDASALDCPTCTSPCSKLYCKKCLQKYNTYGINYYTDKYDTKIDKKLLTFFEPDSKSFSEDFEDIRLEINPRIASQVGRLIDSDNTNYMNSLNYSFEIDHVNYTKSLTTPQKIDRCFYVFSEIGQDMGALTAPLTASVCKNTRYKTFYTNNLTYFDSDESCIKAVWADNLVPTDRFGLVEEILTLGINAYNLSLLTPDELPTKPLTGNAILDIPIGTYNAAVVVINATENTIMDAAKNIFGLSKYDDVYNCISQFGTPGDKITTTINNVNYQSYANIFIPEITNRIIKTSNGPPILDLSNSQFTNCDIQNLFRIQSDDVNTRYKFYDVNKQIISLMNFSNTSDLFHEIATGFENIFIGSRFNFCNFKDVLFSIVYVYYNNEFFIPPLIASYKSNNTIVAETIKFRDVKIDTGVKVWDWLCNTLANEGSISNQVIDNIPINPGQTLNLNLDYCSFTNMITPPDTLPDKYGIVSNSRMLSENPLGATITDKGYTGQLYHIIGENQDYNNISFTSVDHNDITIGHLNIPGEESFFSQHVREWTGDFNIDYSKKIYQTIIAEQKLEYAENVLSAKSHLIEHTLTQPPMGIFSDSEMNIENIEQTEAESELKTLVDDTPKWTKILSDDIHEVYNYGPKVSNINNSFSFDELLIKDIKNSTYKKYIYTRTGEKLSKSANIIYTIAKLILSTFDNKIRDKTFDIYNTDSDHTKDFIRTHYANLRNIPNVSKLGNLSKVVQMTNQITNGYSAHLEKNSTALNNSNIKLDNIANNYCYFHNNMFNHSIDYNNNIFTRCRFTHNTFNIYRNELEPFMYYGICSTIDTTSDPKYSKHFSDNNFFKMNNDGTSNSAGNKFVFLNKTKSTSTNMYFIVIDNYDNISKKLLYINVETTDTTIYTDLQLETSSLYLAFQDLLTNNLLVYNQLTNCKIIVYKTETISNHIARIANSLTNIVTKGTNDYNIVDILGFSLLNYNGNYYYKLIENTSPIDASIIKINRVAIGKDIYKYSYTSNNSDIRKGTVLEINNLRYVVVHTEVSSEENPNYPYGNINVYKLTLSIDLTNYPFVGYSRSIDLSKTPIPIKIIGTVNNLIKSVHKHYEYGNLHGNWYNMFDQTDINPFEIVKNKFYWNDMTSINDDNDDLMYIKSHNLQINSGGIYIYQPLRISKSDKNPYFFSKSFECKLKSSIGLLKGQTVEHYNNSSTIHQPPSSPVTKILLNLNAQHNLIDTTTDTTTGNILELKTYANKDHTVDYKSRQLEVDYSKLITIEFDKLNLSNHFICCDTKVYSINEKWSYIDIYIFQKNGSVFVVQLFTDNPLKLILGKDTIDGKIHIQATLPGNVIVDRPVFSHFSDICIHTNLINSNLFYEISINKNNPICKHLFDNVLNQAEFEKWPKPFAHMKINYLNYRWEPTIDGNYICLKKNYVEYKIEGETSNPYLNPPMVDATSFEVFHTFKPGDKQMLPLIHHGFEDYTNQSFFTNLDSMNTGMGIIQSQYRKQRYENLYGVSHKKTKFYETAKTFNSCIFSFEIFDLSKNFEKSFTMNNCHFKTTIFLVDPSVEGFVFTSCTFANCNFINKRTIEYLTYHIDNTKISFNGCTVSHTKLTNLLVDNTITTDDFELINSYNISDSELFKK